LTPVQENLLILLKEIDEICKKHNIIYYLAGGTALGAVRNAGFLPWDDDIDIYITRDNWKKFESIIDEELKPDREIACVERNDLYRNPIPRYIDKNTTSSYENYISDFHQFIDINESLKKFYEYKQYNVKALESVETNIVNRHKLNSIRHKIRIENNLKNKKTDLKMMLKNRDYDKLNDIFEDYYQYQLDSNFMKWDIYIDINDEYLYIALMLLIIQGEYFNALKILKLRERESILSRELSVVKELALAVRDLSILIYDENNYIEAETLLKKWFNLFPDILDFKRHNLLLSIYFAKDKNEFNQIKKMHINI